MVIRYLFLPILLLLQFSLHAKNPTSHWNFPKIVYSQPTSCNLPAPNDLAITQIGSNWVQTTWTPVSGASQYRLQAFDGQSGAALAFPIFVSGTSVSANVSTVGNNGTVFVRIWSVCDGGDFDLARFDQSDTVDVVIIDLVVLGFQLPPICSNFEMPTFGVNIPIDGSYRYFKVAHTENGTILGPRHFSARMETQSSPDKLEIRPDAETTLPIIFDVEYQNGVANAFRIYIKTPNGAKLVAYLQGIYSATGAVTFIRTGPYNDSNCHIFQLIPCPSSKPGIDTPEGTMEDRYEEVPVFNNTTVVPNPFHDYMQVNLAATADPAGTDLTLYDLLGAKRMTYNAPPGTTEINISTSLLEPGIYFMRVQSSDRKETIKLIKRE